MIGWWKRRSLGMLVWGVGCSGLLLAGVIGCGSGDNPGGGGGGGGGGGAVRNVTGTVIDENGNALQGVTVRVVNAATAAVQTDAAGKYTLVSVPEGNQTLQFVDRNGNTSTVTIVAGQTAVGPVIIVSGLSGPPPPPQF